MKHSVEEERRDAWSPLIMKVFTDVSVIVGRCRIFYFFFLFTKSWAFKSSEKLTAYVSIIVQQLEAEQLKPVVAI